MKIKDKERKTKGDGKLASRKKKKRKKDRTPKPFDEDALHAVPPSPGKDREGRKPGAQSKKPLVVPKDEIEAIRIANREVIAARSQHSLVRQAFLQREDALLGEIKEKAEELKTLSERACRNLVGDKMDSEDWRINILEGTIVRVE